MATATDYFSGGFDPSRRAANRSSEYDLDADTYTRWDEQGNVIESRPLTVDEIAALTPPPPVPVPAADRLDEAAAGLRTIAAESVTADAARLDTVAAHIEAAAAALRGVQ